MSQPFQTAYTRSDYPLFAVDFDPEDDSRIIAGGGGGPNRSGVPNKLTVLETTGADTLRIAAELDLPRSEDSVMSLAFTGRKGKTISVLAGVNSHQDEIVKGKNEHLRSISIRGTGSETSIKEEFRHPLIIDSTAAVYQRLLRVAGTLGAVASANGKDPQIALFDVPSSKGNALKRRGTIELPREAEDLDIVQLADGSHLMTYCYGYELFLVKVGKEQQDPQLIYSIPADEANRPKFRFARFLGPEFVLTVANIGRAGAVIHGFRLPKAGQEKARLAVSAKLDRKTQATAFALASLTRPTLSPKGGIEALGDTQFVIAVARGDASISLMSLTHVASPAINLLTKLHPLTTVLGVHGNSEITGMALSTFSTPTKKAALGETQYLKLVSVTMSKSIALQSIPLKQFIDKTPRSKNAPPRPIRYVTKLDAREPTTARTAITLFSFVALLLALIGQCIVEVMGTGYPILNPQRFFPGVSTPVSTPIVAPPVVQQQQQHTAPVVAEVDSASLLRDDFLAKIVGDGQVPTDVVVLVAETPAPAAGEDGTAAAVADIKAEAHDEQVHGPGKSWEDLPEAQQHAWKARLHDAGAWTQQMGETVFKGILFGEIGGAIGHAMAG
ncbi:guanine nucleotide exchange factor-like protein [Cordyceps javanica]|uniref:Guanine nucleotide-exchange factor SEC12 n=1 Tax=Cordyceps javanica TaxID=43265 RepID=A0A545VE96_9HYPO|nr:guanine nucleotide exchange factor-like protein [Cordyceps javanica]TQW10287.1 guanine nucleotide exchange factor-like protein [Cordyceps javanica]